MNDDPTETFLRASALLDGELDAVEATRAEADPAVMAEVTRLRALQAGLAAVDPPTDAVRESAIAAALTEFDTVRSETGHPTVVPFRPRPAYTKWLGVAAAVVAIGVLGVLLSTRPGGGDDSDEAGGAEAGEQFDLEAAATAVPEAAADLPAGDATAQPPTALGSAPSGAAQAPMSAAAESAAPDATEAPAATELAAIAEEASRAGDDAAADVSAPSAPAQPLLITDETDLGALGQRLLEQQRAGSLPVVAETECDDTVPYVVLTEAQFDGNGAPVVPVLVTIDPDTLQTFVIDPVTCAVVATDR